MAGLDVAGLAIGGRAAGGMAGGAGLATAGFAMAGRGAWAVGVVGAGGRATGAGLPIAGMGRAAAGLRGLPVGATRRAAMLRGGVLRGTGLLMVARASGGMRFAAAFLPAIRLGVAALPPRAAMAPRPASRRFAAARSVAFAGLDPSFGLVLEALATCLFLIGFLMVFFVGFGCLAGVFFFAGVLPPRVFFLPAIVPLLTHIAGSGAAADGCSVAIGPPPSNISDVE
jgi:hypothetical protein